MDRADIFRSSTLLLSSSSEKISKKHSTTTIKPQQIGASTIFGITAATKHDFLNEHCHGIISKFWHLLELEFIKVS